MATTPEWFIDHRHREWLYAILTSHPFKTTLELGTYSGFSAEAFFKAQESNKDMVCHFCDTEVIPEFTEKLKRHPERVVFHNKLTLDVLNSDIDFDVVFVDADHRLPAVTQETEVLLKRRPLVVMAHDTNATSAKYLSCEGAAHLKWKFSVEPGYYCLEDGRRRNGERTERGFFFATTDLGILRSAQESLKLTGGTGRLQLVVVGD